jgi:hypothetical protein
VTGRAWLLPVSLLLATPVFVGGPSCAILAAVPRLWRARHDYAPPHSQQSAIANST